MNENIIEVLNNNGTPEHIEILKYFSLKSNGKDYILYKKDLKNTKEYIIYSAEIKELSDNIILNSIEDKEVLDEIKNIVEEIKNG